MRYALLLVIVATGCKGDDQIDTSELNAAPQANAGPDLTQPSDRAAHLDGRASYDPDGDPLRYIWSFDAVPTGSTLPDRASPFSVNEDLSGSTTFTPDKTGVYVVQLIVHDGFQASAPDYVIVTATDPDTVPIAVAGPDQLVPLGDTVQLDGSASWDPLGGALTYAWTVVDVPYNSSIDVSDLSGATTATPSLAPDVIGDYTLTLVVDNGMASSPPDSVQVRVVGTDEPPVADAGEDVIGEDCTLIALDCTSSNDPQGLPLTYFWELQSRPTGSAANNKSFADRTDGDTTFWPDVAGTYVVSCSVFDGSSWSAPDPLTLTLAERVKNTSPTAKAGADRKEPAGDAECVLSGYTYECEDCDSFRVALGPDGVASDPDGDPVTILWSILDTSTKLVDDDVLPSEAILPKTTPTSLGTCVTEKFSFELSVQDCPGAISTDRVDISAECCGVSP